MLLLLGLLLTAFLTANTVNAVPELSHCAPGAHAANALCVGTYLTASMCWVTLQGLARVCHPGQGAAAGCIRPSRLAKGSGLRSSVCAPLAHKCSAAGRCCRHQVRADAINLTSGMLLGRKWFAYKFCATQLRQSGDPQLRRAQARLAVLSSRDQNVVTRADVITLPAHVSSSKSKLQACSCCVMIAPMYTLCQPMLLALLMVYTMSTQAVRGV